jgi:hypothetical protein
MNFTEDILNVIKRKLDKTFWFLSLHAFSLIIIFVVIDLAFGAIIFYKDIFSAEVALPTVNSDITKFDKVRFNNVLDQLERRGLIIEKNISN